MLRLSKLSIRQKLYGVVVISTLGLIAVAGISVWLLLQFRVDGPVYSQIISAKELVSDTTPSPLFIIEPFVTLYQLSEAEDPQRIRELREYLYKVEGIYRERRAHWAHVLPEGKLRTELDAASVPADELFHLAKNDLLPAKARADHKAAREIMKTIVAKFEEHQKAIAKVAEMTRHLVAAEEAGAIERLRDWGRIMLLIGLTTLVLVVASGLLLARNVVYSAQVLRDRVCELASGESDLTARVEVCSQDELGDLAGGLNAMIGKIQAIVERVREASVQLLSTASQIAAAAGQQESSMQGLGGSTAEIAAAVQEITATSKQLSDTMGGVNAQASAAAGLATMGRTRLTDMQKAMQQLVDSTASISSKLALIREKAENINVVVSTITKVADQTNLLSINAAIEAEKAGEFGRGFLVVAREIRRLADQTAVATLDIENMVRLMHDAVSSGVMQMDKFSEEVRTGMGRVAELGTDTGRIIEEVQGLSERFEQVNDGMRQQALGAQQINDAMLSVSTTTRQQAQALDEFKKATTYLRQSVESLNREVGQFKV